MDTYKKKLLETLELHKGIVTNACKSIDCPRSTYYKYLNEDEEFRLAVEEIQETAIDFVEGKLMQKINGVTMLNTSVKKSDEEDEDPTYILPPSDTAIIFYLKTKGKKRGYIERMEVDNLTPIQVMTLDPLNDPATNDSPAQNIVTS